MIGVLTKKGKLGQKGYAYRENTMVSRKMAIQVKERSLAQLLPSQPSDGTESLDSRLLASRIMRQGMFVA